MADQAATLSTVLSADADLVVASAWLHDIGYSPSLVSIGFHPLDGARYLRDVEHADGPLCRLVAHHTGALVEAEEAGCVMSWPANSLCRPNPCSRRSPTST
ncbi:HD domain-containing protein [Marinactinospora rubrisoli]|uniref:HD domain-containing protein n=1 Tax=Marinactinospora rubrisoli TaxID=2715399 RepID=A0ABW2KFP5_9ACTN